MARKKKTKVDASGEGFGGSFADLLKAQGLVAQDATPSAEVAAPEAAPAATLSEVSRVVLRVTRKGRAGKTVTLVEGLEGLDLEAIARQIRAALGVGSSVDDEDVLVVQGDQRDRLARWLEGEGVRRIVRG